MNCEQSEFFNILTAHLSLTIEHQQFKAKNWSLHRIISDIYSTLLGWRYIEENKKKKSSEKLEKNNKLITDNAPPQIWKLPKIEKKCDSSIAKKKKKIELNHFMQNWILKKMRNDWSVCDPLSNQICVPADNDWRSID